MLGKKFQVMNEHCDECLFTVDAIVSSYRCREIIAECLKNDKYFICHKSSMHDGEVCCRMFYDAYGRDIHITRIATILKAVEFVGEADATKD